MQAAAAFMQRRKECNGHRARCRFKMGGVFGMKFKHKKKKGRVGVSSDTTL